MTDTPNVFISYARADGSDYSERLRDTLRADGITCWRDDRIDPTIDFTGEIETALDEATHVAVIVTADLKRADSFVRLEIGYALTHKKPIIPLVFEGGHRPITIINHTYISFVDWDTGYEMLLTRLKDFGTGEIDPATLQERELAYIQAVGRAYDHWRDLYTDLSAVARIEERKVKPKSAAARYLQMRHKIHQKRDYSPDAEKGKVVTTESFDELREGIRKYGRVALIGDPGAGKTTTLERLAYEYAASAVDDKGERIAGTPLPLFVRLGAYDGTDFTQFLASFFGNLPLENYLPDGVLLLLDGLNEMPAEHMGTVEAWLREHENVKVIVSCRKLEYVERKLPLQRIDVAPLDLERIRLFLTNYLEDEDRDRLFWGLAGYEARKAWAWYQGKVDEATYRSFFTATDKIGDEWEPERKSLDRIRQALREDAQLPDMLGVVTNPFLLFGVIEIFIIEGTVPRNKGELFGHFVDSLLAERGQVAEREDRPWIVENKQKQALATLAYQMQAEKRGTSVALDFVMQCFHDAVPEEDPDTLLYFAISASILEQSDTVRFSHQLLQEYFAAYEMGEDMRRGVPASKYFPSDAWWEPTGWEETAVLLAGMEGNASTVVKWLTPIQPDLAYKVATESGAVCSGDAMQGLYRPAEGARRSPYALAEWGRKIADDDSRPGVGLRADGLPDIVWGEPVVAGTYKIGGDEKARKSLPEQDVTFDYSYRLAIYPITVKQFEIFLKVQDGIALDRWWSSLSFGWGDKQVGEQTEKSANHPRTDVNWYQAVAFCRWLTVQYRDANLLDADSEIRLPTGQEWEVVARYPDGRAYPWGNDYRVGCANCDEQERGDGPYLLNRSVAVGLYEKGKQPHLGIYDLSGTVWEWCLNESSKPERTATEGTALRVLRGGSWRSLTSLARAASRLAYDPLGRSSFIGFRVVLAPVQSLSSESSGL